MARVRRRTISLPVTLSVALMTLNVVLMVCWIILLYQHYQWTALTAGTILFALILAGLVVYLVLTIKEIRLNQRQANFIDSVTHELKSPIASLKLYLETLQLRSVDEAQRKKFYGFMIEDANRLDRLINELLEAGRLDAIVDDAMNEDIDVEKLLRECAQVACNHHKRQMSDVTFTVQPTVIRGVRLALEMIFRNLIDNAFKYSGEDARVEVSAKVTTPDRVVITIADNGMGVPSELSTKIFGLFYRGGSELHRTRKGTGLGLYIVSTLVKRMKGKVCVQSRGKEPGAIFEVDLPGRKATCAS